MQRQGLYRSRRDRVLGGVAGGIAHALNTDPVIIRILFALMVIVAGGGVLLYLILWIAIPEEPFEFSQPGPAPGSQEAGNETGSPEPAYQPPVYPQRKNNGALIVGLILIVIGAIFLLDRFLPYFRFHLHDFWPIIIVIAGFALIYSSFSGIKKS